MTTSTTTLPSLAQNNLATSTSTTIYPQLSTTNITSNIDDPSTHISLFSLSRTTSPQRPGWTKTRGKEEKRRGGIPRHDGCIWLSWPSAGHAVSLAYTTNGGYLKNFNLLPSPRIWFFFFYCYTSLQRKRGNAFVLGRQRVEFQAL